ncbi:MAG: bacterial Ig-like domain-containing protein [Paludibacteraceae bacterium]|nr:bacterial Ig-like domain-containing protein [Paludibacteraceae bacterium]
MNYDDDGLKKFVGWTATANYSSDDTAPEFVKDGDDAEATTYYAVYAEESGSGAITWNLVTNASTLKAGDVLVIASNSAGKTAGDISSEIMGSVNSTFSSGDSYATITSLGAETVELTLGGSVGEWTLSSTNGLLGATTTKKLAWDSGTTTWSISISGGNATIQNGTSGYGRFLYNTSSPRFTTYTSDPSATMLLPQLYRKTGGVSYSNYSTSCEACALSSITLNTTDVTKNYYTGDAFDATGLVVTANYSNCSDKVVTPTEISTPDMSVAGEKTITVSYTENEVTKTATFTITVTDKPTYAIRFFNNGAQVGETQNVTEDEEPEIPDVTPCEGYAFEGWWTSELAEDNTEEKEWITDFTATQDQDYYAIYSIVVTDPSSSVVSIEAADLSSVGTGEEIGTQTVKGVAIKGEVGSNSSANAPKYYLSGTTHTIRFYAGNKLTISADGTISQIDFNHDGSYNGGSITPASGAWASTPTEGWNKTWTGETNSIRFTINGSAQWRITEMQVTIGGGSTTYYTSTETCTSTGIEETEVSQQAVMKVLREGQIYLMYNGTMYNIQGQRVK